MPEYFEITLILEKDENGLSQVRSCLDSLQLFEGENEADHPLLETRDNVVSYYDDEEQDYYEVTIGLPDKVFHPDLFESQVENISKIVRNCFKSTDKLLFALCSFEINSYLMTDVTRIEEIDSSLLSKFPIAFTKNNGSSDPQLHINLQAQNLWSENDY